MVTSPAPPRPFGAIRLVGVLFVLLWTFLALPGFSRDRASLLAFGVLAVVLVASVRVPALVTRARELVSAPSTRSFVIGSALAAAFVSYLLVSGPMRDRPLSIDAVVYLFQARALSHGHFGVPLPEPHQLFGGRFLFEGVDGLLHGVFPPGFPLFLVPFVWIGMPMLAGPVTAAMLVVSQWLLGRAVEGEDGLATRLSILISLPSFARAVETGDLLSHAFVAALGTAAIALALLCRERASAPRLLAIGAALGFATSARLLDGILFGTVVLGLLLHAVVTRRLRAMQLALPAVSFLPFVAVVLLANKASSGSFWIPTQSTYFARSDWPSTCHRLGFGWDVGCAVEHGDERNSFGPDGYTAIDAVRVVRERAGVIGGDLFGLAPLLLVGLLGVVLHGVAADALLATMVVGFTVAYGLFYYGNAAIFGARHLFPIAPFAWLLVARAVARPASPRFHHAPAVAVVAAVVFAFVPRWLFGMNAVSRANGSRLDLRGVIDRAGIDKGLVVTGDDLAWLAAFDPSADGPSRILVRFDGSGLKDLRRTYPDLPVHAVLEGDTVQTQKMAPVPPGLLVELERTWPSFVRPLATNGVGTKVINAKNCCKLEASGEKALFVFQARGGDAFEVPFTAPLAGRFTLRLEGLVAPDYGTWSVRVDDHELPAWDGYAKELGLQKGAPSAPIELAAGHHTITFRCTGKRPESTGFLGAFDALVGSPSTGSGAL